VPDVLDSDGPLVGARQVGMEHLYPARRASSSLARSVKSCRCIRTWFCYTPDRQDC